jgi:hypothetical protein
MVLQEQKFKNQFSDIIAAFEAAFPDIIPPESRWITLWLGKYPVWAIKDAIRQLSKHSLKARFTTDSTGKAISALLRAESLIRATSGEPKTGGTR